MNEISEKEQIILNLMKHMNSKDLTKEAKIALQKYIDYIKEIL